MSKAVRLIFVFVPFLPIAADAVTFADGLHHVLDATNSYPFEDVLVFDGPGGEQTAVEILEGGQVGTLSDGSLVANERSQVATLGGSVCRVDLNDQAHATIAGGKIELLRARSFSVLEFEGGEVGHVCGLMPPFGDLIAEDNALVRISGGRLHRVTIGGTSRAELTGDGVICVNLTVTDSAVMEITGGFPNVCIGSGSEPRPSGVFVEGHGTLLLSAGSSISVNRLLNFSENASGVLSGTYDHRGEARLFDNAQLRLVEDALIDHIRLSSRAKVEVVGGELNSIGAEGEASVSVAGGRLGTLRQLPGGVSLSDTATGRVSGGTIEGSVTVLDSAHLAILGQSFNHPLGEIAQTTGFIEGLLSDGSAISVIFTKAPTATILLLPEPCRKALSLSAAAAVAALTSRRRRLC